jgi:hypothetical protein
LGGEREAQLGVKQLQRHRPLVLEILRQVDRSHAAAAELALERVLVTERVDDIEW